MYVKLQNFIKKDAKFYEIYKKCMEFIFLRNSKCKFLYGPYAQKFPINKMYSNYHRVI